MEFVHRSHKTLCGFSAFDSFPSPTSPTPTAAEIHCKVKDLRNRSTVEIQRPVIRRTESQRSKEILKPAIILDETNLLMVAQVAVAELLFLLPLFGTGSFEIYSSCHRANHLKAQIKLALALEINFLEENSTIKP
ncbi:hypothetical protein QAD02_012580 [Eretmocerus hayati]|uniref:Uncharacterized protein n=1 Tax=Eretmocerus hayati TaxID=131215 RepID=A0ACC2P030_9HYME|nr:hypothetical protein QAD02_012580 [Eretmocerus hayati]